MQILSCVPCHSNLVVLNGLLCWVLDNFKDSFQFCQAVKTFFLLSTTLIIFRNFCSFVSCQPCLNMLDGFQSSFKSLLNITSSEKLTLKLSKVNSSYLVIFFLISITVCYSFAYSLLSQQLLLNQQLRESRDYVCLDTSHQFNIQHVGVTQIFVQ